MKRPFAVTSAGVAFSLLLTGLAPARAGQATQRPRKGAYIVVSTMSTEGKASIEAVRASALPARIDKAKALFAVALTKWKDAHQRAKQKREPFTQPRPVLPYVRNDLRAGFGAIEAARLAAAKAKKGREERFKGVYIPRDLEDCFKEIPKIVKPQLLEEMKAQPTKEDMITYHFGFGMWLRNRWGLWVGSRLQAYFLSYGISHPDNMSSIILDGFWLHLRGRPIPELEENPQEVERLWQQMREAAERNQVRP